MHQTPPPCFFVSTHPRAQLYISQKLFNYLQLKNHLFVIFREISCRGGKGALVIYEYALSNYLFSLWQISCETINTAPGSSRVDTTMHNDYEATECVISENIHTSPTEGIFF